MISISNIFARIFLGVRIPKTIRSAVLAEKDDLRLDRRSYAVNRDKFFADLATDARETLDFGYRKTGKYPSDSFSDDDWHAVGLGTLPRRGLFAMVCNDNEIFSEYEVSAAKWRMAYLHKNAMRAANPFGLESRRRAMLKASIRYLEMGSQEEKSSSEWREAIDAAHRAYADWQPVEAHHAKDKCDNLAA